MTAGSPPVIRVNGRLERLLDYDKLSPEETRTLIYRIISTEQQKHLETGRQTRLLALDPRPGALPGQRVLPAREPRGSVPDDSRAHQDARRAQHADAAVRARRQAPRSRPRHRARPARASRRRSRRCSITSTRRDTSTSSRSRIRSSSCTGTARASSTSASSAPTRRRSREALRAALREDPDVILVGEMRDLETISDRADRRRDRAPRLRDAAHSERTADDRPRHRRVPGRPAGSGSRSARGDAAGHRHAEPRSRPPTAAAALPRSRSSFRTTRCGTSSGRRRSSRSTRSCRRAPLAGCSRWSSRSRISSSGGSSPPTSPSRARRGPTSSPGILERAGVHGRLRTSAAVEPFDAAGGLSDVGLRLAVGS